ncbi:MAG TPA: hypothetical protein VLT33_19895 [Labilithrix sp.]|nr:hypothetical protein [Labilithrix sp.]
MTLRPPRSQGRALRRAALGGAGAAVVALVAVVAVGGGCTTTLTFPPGGAEAAAEGGDSEADGAGAPNIVFLSVATAAGDMDFALLSLESGVAAADEQCNEEAQAAKLGGTFVAWLSADNAGPLGRLPKLARWALPDGTPVFPSSESILTGPLSAINVGASGAPVPAPLAVWTGTKADGMAGENCGNWGTAAAASVGLVSQPSQWATSQNKPCREVAHVYCFQK